MIPDTKNFQISCPADQRLAEEWSHALNAERIAVTDSLDSRKDSFQAIGHRIRLEILYYLRGRANCVCELVRKTGASNSAVSYHLRLLEKVGAVIVEYRSGRVYYLLTESGNSIVKWIDSIPQISEPLKIE